MKKGIRFMLAIGIGIAWLLVVCQLTWDRPFSSSYRIEKKDLTHDQGHCYRWSLPKVERANPSGLADAIVLEDGHRLARSSSRKNVQAGQGFTFSDKGLYFAAIDGSDPRSNPSQYEFLNPHLPNELALTLLLALPVALSIALGRFRSWIAWLPNHLLGCLRYLASESPHSYAMARMSLGGVMLWTSLTRFDTTFIKRTSAVAAIRYDPVGIWRLLPHHGFPAHFLHGLTWLLPLFCLLLIFGIGGRAVLALALLFFWMLACAEFSVTDALSHDFHGPLFIGLGLLLGWSNLLPFIGRPLLGRTQGFASNTRWALLAALTFFSFIFFDAALYKIYLGNQDFLGWIFSDNLRNKLLIRYQVSLTQEPSFLPRLLIEHPLLCRFAALMAVMGQFLPIFGVFFLTKQRLRWIFAATVAFCLIGLKITMGISWVLPWLPFACLFIDFDSFKLARPPYQLAAPRFSKAAMTAFLVGFLWVVGASLIGRQTRLLYPLGPFPMYSNIEAAKPYSKHLPFERMHNEWRWQEAPLTSEDSALFQRKFRGLLGAHDQIDSVIRSAKAWITASSTSSPTTIEVRRNDYRIESHPAPKVTLLRSAILARMEGDSVIRPQVRTLAKARDFSLSVQLDGAAPEQLSLWTADPLTPDAPYDADTRLYQVTNVAVQGQNLHLNPVQSSQPRLFLKASTSTETFLYELVADSSPETDP